MTSRSYELRLEGISSPTTGEISLRDPSALEAPQQQTVTRIARHLARLAVVAGGRCAIWRDALGFRRNLWR